MTSHTWDPTAPLGRGVTLLEASAGTGKTYGITSVIVRLVAELGVPIERVLVVTFTRAATAELKERVRDRLVGAVAALESDASPEDVVLAQLWQAGRDDATTRRTHLRRLRDAVEGFDQALISTIHGFCQRMLQQNAFESHADFGLELATDTDDLVEELVDDFLVRTLHQADAAQIGFLREACGFGREALVGLARRAVADPDVEVVPGVADVDPAAWNDLVASLRARWPALGASLVAYVDGEHRAQKTGSRLSAKQRKVNGAYAQVYVDAVTDWLQRDPTAMTPLPADALGAIIAPQLAVAGQPLEHDALDALDELRAFLPRLASCRRAAFVAEARATFAVRKERRRVQTYQDLLRGLAQRLGDHVDPDERAVLAAAVGAGFDAALIDEFQDTDADQWTIFRACFGTGRHHLFLIGDPKQAIYGFRGANIHVYAAASGAAGDGRFTMRTNWRSDARLLDALNLALDHPGMFGSATFAYVPVEPSPRRQRTDGLRPPHGWEGAAALQLRWFDGTFGGGDPDAVLSKDAVDAAIPSRVADDVVALLDRAGATQILDGKAWRDVQPRDVAVLVRKGRQAVAVQAALTAAGVPAVLTGAASVLASDEALAVQHWLEALAETSGGTAARVSASSLMFGWTAERLLAVEAEEQEAVGAWDVWLGQLASWRDRLQRRGFMVAFRHALDEVDALPRLLGLSDGERRVTNLLHAAELVHAGETRERLKLTALLAWLKRRRSEEDLEADEVELRLDRDADAVQILTIHKSKGLEFPICFVPYLWDGALLSRKELPALLFPHPDDPTRRLLDVHADPKAPPKCDHVLIAQREVQEENLRLAYVALTRARHRCVVYGGRVKSYGTSPLAAILHGEGADRLASAEAFFDAADGAAALLAPLEVLATVCGADGAPLVDVSACLPAEGHTWVAGPAPERALRVRTFGRLELDPDWRRHSYTSLVRAAGHAVLTVVEDGREGFDRDGHVPEVAVDDVADRAAPSVEEEVPLSGFPAGAAAGTLLHEVFEHLDFATAHDGATTGDGVVDAAARAAVADVVRDRLTVHGFDADAWTERLTVGLVETLRTPLGAVLGDLRLCDVARGDRLNELRFDLPLAGGSGHGAAPVDAAELADALRRRTDLPDAWLATLDRLDGIRLAGFLTGSIDLVFRAPTPHGLRWFVADYKSNRLAPRGTRRCVPSAFDASGMRHEMARHDYFLQAHLYLVALHRYLKWRLPNYDYDRDVGGAYYLFFRGMVGMDTMREGTSVRGSYYDRPPREVIEALDAAFASTALGGAA